MFSSRLLYCCESFILRTLGHSKASFFVANGRFYHEPQQLQVISNFLMHKILSAKPNHKKPNEKERKIMANTKNGSNQGMVPEARAAMDRFKMEAAAEVDVPSSY